MIECLGCNKKISTSINNCPNCGKSLESTVDYWQRVNKGKWNIVITIVVIIIGLSLIEYFEI